MKCPNCRCIVPNNVSRCTYCGYDFMSGSAKTLTIEEAYKFKTYDYDYNCDNYADEFYAYDDYYNCESYKQKMRLRTDGKLMITVRLC